jgi:hypothetical protein
MLPIKRGNKPVAALLSASPPAKQATATARPTMELLRYLQVIPIFQTLIGEQGDAESEWGR